MRYLGIDYGSKNIGLAISDENGSIAFPDRTLPNNKKIVAEISAICGKHKIKTIIMGESRDYSGKLNPIMVEALDFGEALEQATGLKVETEPEFLTSHQVERTEGGSNQVDASAAAIILQSFLDRKNTKTEDSEFSDEEELSEELL